MKFLATTALAIFVAGCSQAEKPFEQLTSELQESVKKGDYPNAKKSLDAMVQQRPKDLSALVGRGGIAVFLGDAVSAETDFRAAAAIDQKKAAQARQFFCDRAEWIAREYEIKKRFREAIAIYDCIITLYPKSGMTYHDRGGAKSDTGDYQGAIDDLTKAIEFDTGNNSAGDSYVLRARAKRAMGDVKGAEDDERRAESRK